MIRMVSCSCGLEMWWWAGGDANAMAHGWWGSRAGLTNAGLGGEQAAVSRPSSWRHVYWHRYQSLSLSDPIPSQLLMNDEFRPNRGSSSKTQEIWASDADHAVPYRVLSFAPTASSAIKWEIAASVWQDLFPSFLLVPQSSLSSPPLANLWLRSPSASIWLFPLPS